MAAFTGNLTGPRSKEQGCPHTCSQCGRGGYELVFDAIRNAEIQVTRNGKLERYEVHGMVGEYPYVIHAWLAPGSAQIELPPAPAEVWLLYGNGGSYSEGGNLKGIYATEEQAKDSAKYLASQERVSFSRRLGKQLYSLMLKNQLADREEELEWEPIHHERHGPIPGYSYAQAGFASFVVERHKVRDEQNPY